MSIIQEALKKAEGRKVVDVKEMPAAGPVQAAIRHEGLPATGAQRPQQTANNRLAVAAAALFLVFLFVLLAVSVRQFFVVRSNAPVSSAASGAVRMVPEEPRETATAKIGDLPRLSAGLSSISGGARSRFLLNGIMYLDYGAKAIINGSVVMEGDMIDGAKVVKIARDGVFLKDNGEDVVLRLKD